MKLKPPKESMPIEIPYSRAYPSYPAGLHTPHKFKSLGISTRLVTLIHLQMYCCKLAQYFDNDSFFIRTFQDSLTGSTNMLEGPG